MATQTDRLMLPLLDAGQAQKELFHNEALTSIDLLLHGAVEDSGIDTPPGTPALGQCWIVGASPTGAWAGQAEAIAGWTGGGWRFLAPRAGISLWQVANGYHIYYDGTDWIIGTVPATALEIGGIQVVGAQSGAIADPSGGTTVDSEARTTIVAILSALRTHGLIAP